MMSRFLSLLKAFGPSGARSNVHPNSWASISVWRRFFALKDEEEELQCQQMKWILEQAGAMDRMEPIRSGAVVEERHRQVRDAYLAAQGIDTRRPAIMNKGNRHAQTYDERRNCDRFHAERMMQDTREEQQIHRPNLDIRVGTDYRTLPQ